MAFGYMLAFLLTTSKRLRSSELRDRVFGLIGLLRLVAPKRSFHVDYTDSVADVYCDATRECAKAFGGFWDLEEAVTHDRQTWTLQVFLPGSLPGIAMYRHG